MTNLHSSMERLKVAQLNRYKHCKARFTFQYGEIKRSVMVEYC